MKLRLFKSNQDPPTLIGKVFNDLTVVRKTTERQNGHVIYECRCICGNTTRVRGTRLTNGITKSCGKCQKKVGRVGILPMRRR